VWLPQGGTSIGSFGFEMLGGSVRDESEETDHPSNRKERAEMHARG